MPFSGSLHDQSPRGPGALRILRCIAVAGVVAAQLAGCAAAPPPQTRTDDTVISTRVRSALSTEPTLGTAIVRVTTVGGNVRLTGTADSISKIERIGSVTRTIGGVRSIQNDVALVATGTGALSKP